MTQVVVVLDSAGTYEAAYGDSEVEVKVLKRGTDDSEIDEVEARLTEIEGGV